MNGMNVICVFFGTLFLAAGMLFASGRGHIHLAAWKNMPLQEKKKIRIQPLCRNIGGVMALSGMIFLLKGLWPGFENQWFVVSMVIWFLIAGLDVWYITKSNRYSNK